MGVVEGAARARGLPQEADRLDEFLVGVRHRRERFSSAVAVLDDDAVPAVQLDVLGLGNLEQGLQAAVSEDRILGCHCIGLFRLQGPQRLAFADEPLGM